MQATTDNTLQHVHAAETADTQETHHEIHDRNCKLQVADTGNIYDSASATDVSDRPIETEDYSEEGKKYALVDAACMIHEDDPQAFSSLGANASAQPTGPLTTFLELAAFRASKHTIFLKANPQRGNTMKGDHNVHFNEGISPQYGWYTYNVVLSGPTYIRSVPNVITQDITIFDYDNGQNSQPYEETVTHVYSEQTTASLTIARRAAIKLGVSFSIQGIGGTDISMDIASEATQTQEKVTARQLTRTFPVRVEAGERFTIVQTEQRQTTSNTYEVLYGLSGYVGTNGKRWNGHNNWGFPVGRVIEDRTGVAVLVGTGTTTHMSFEIKRTRQAAPVNSQMLYH